MMIFTKRIVFCPPHKMLGFLMAVLLIALPSKVKAACEQQTTAIAGQTAAIAAQTTTVTAMTAAVMGAAAAAIAASEAALMAALDVMDTNVRTNTLADWWNDYREGLEEQTKQLNTARLDATKMIGLSVEAQSFNNALRQLQLAESDARQSYRPNELSCVVDSYAMRLSKARAVSEAMTRTFASDNAKLMVNQTGTPAINRQQLQLIRFRDYCRFSNPDFNDGHTGCPSGPGINAVADPSLMDADVLVGDTLFGRHTLDFRNTAAKTFTGATNPPTLYNTTLGRENVTAAQVILYRLTDILPQEPISNTEIKTAPGQERILQTRSIAAQNNVAQSLIASIISERTPSKDPAPEVRAMRLAAGIEPSRTYSHPSEREVREAMIDQLRTPSFYARLGNSEEELMRTETELRAFNLMQLLRMTEKLERMAVASSVELAIRLERNASTAKATGSGLTPNN
jgi:hypothetical protein